MTHQPKLVELAERIEKATGPDRNIDLAIAVTLNRDDIFDAHYTWRWGSGGDEIEAWEEDARKPSGYLDPAQFCPRFTASLDAAMTLVDEGMAKRGYYLTLQHDPFDRAGRPWAARFDTAGDECGHGDTIYAAAATPALALCAASLRAMEQRNA